MDVSTIKNIWCIGRNYVAHAKELNNPIPASPLIFLKAGTCINPTKNITLPDWTSDIHHECELAVLIDKNGAPKSLALALDLTAREVQSQLKEKGSPWTLAKSFKGACPVSEFIPWTSMDDFQSLNFKFYKNDQRVQEGSPQDMLFSLPTLLNHLQKHYPLAENDLVLTGTPSGVGPIQKGDHLRGEIASGKGTLLLETTWVVN